MELMRPNGCGMGWQGGGREERARRETNTSDLREDIIDTHDAVRPGRAAVVHDGRIALHPTPSRRASPGTGSIWWSPAPLPALMERQKTARGEQTYS